MKVPRHVPFRGELTAVPARGRALLLAFWGVVKQKAVAQWAIKGHPVGRRQ